MCTVSWQREQDSYQVWFNRDEQRSRQIATPPAIYSSSQGLKSIYPVDPQGGGTWFGINEAGLTIGLLNDYQNQTNTKPDDQGEIRSRGLLVKDALETLRVTSADDHEQWLSAECQQRYYRPFYLFLSLIHI